MKNKGSRLTFLRNKESPVPAFGKAGEGALGTVLWCMLRAVYTRYMAGTGPGDTYNTVRTGREVATCHPIYLRTVYMAGGIPPSSRTQPRGTPLFRLS